MEPPAPARDAPPPRRRARWQAVGVGVGLAAFALACLHPGVRQVIASWDVAAIREKLLALGPWAWVYATFLMVLQALVSVLPAFVVTIADGLVFGWLWGGVLALASATLAAQVCFEIARIIGRPAIERCMGAATLDWADRFFERHGVWAVLVARLLPFVPFDPISYAAGLTSTTRTRFLAANLVGQLPATFVYSTIGSRLEGGRLPAWTVWALVGAAAAVLAGVLVRRALSPPSGTGRARPD